VPVAALFVMTLAPCYAVFQSIHTNPLGPLPVLGSFVLLAFGTIAALGGFCFHQVSLHHSVVKTGPRPQGKH
jgi:xanthine/uracil permease